MKSAKWYKSKFIIAVVLPIFTAIVASLIYDSIKGISILTTCKIWGKLIYTLILNFINYEIKVYWIIVSIALIVIIIYIIDKLSTKNPAPKFLNFKEAKPKKLKWTWDYQLDKIRNNYILINLKAHCSSCDTVLVFTISVYGGYIGANCPRCEKSYIANQIDDKDSIQRIIDDDIRRMG